MGVGGCRNLVAKGSEYLIIVSAVFVSLLEHVTGTSFMSNVIFLINLPVCTLIATGGAFMSNVIFLINLPACTLIAMGGGGLSMLHVHPSCQMSSSL